MLHCFLGYALIIRHKFTVKMAKQQIQTCFSAFFLLYFNPMGRFSANTTINILDFATKR